MFNCESCGRTTEPREPEHKRVVKTREKEYTNRLPKGRVVRSRGHETVREISVGDCCAE